MLNAACTAITFKESHGGCGIHEGAVEMIPNSDSGDWPSGYTCYEFQVRFLTILCDDIYHIFILITLDSYTNMFFLFVVG